MLFRSDAISANSRNRFFSQHIANVEFILASLYLSRYNPTLAGGFLCPLSRTRGRRRIAKRSGRVLKRPETTQGAGLSRSQLARHPLIIAQAQTDSDVKHQTIQFRSFFIENDAQSDGSPVTHKLAS